MFDEHIVRLQHVQNQQKHSKGIVLKKKQKVSKKKYQIKSARYR